MDRTVRFHPLAASLLVGVLAGLASALLYAGPVNGAALSVVLAFFTTLPLFVAAQGWGLLASLVACAVSCAGLVGAAAFGQLQTEHPLLLGGLFFVTVAGPAALLSHLGLLARPGDPLPDAGGPPNPASWEWFPVGRIVVWLAALAVGLFLLLDIAIVGGDGGLRGYFLKDLAALPADSEARRFFMSFFPGASWERVSHFLASALPAAVGISWQIMLAVNGIVADQALRTSGRAIRPRLDLGNLALPRVLAGVFAVALALAFAGGRIGYIGGTIAALLYVPYFFLGLTVVHAIPARGAGRIILLALFYFLLLLVSWLSIAVGMLGLVEQWADLRARFVAAAAAREDK